VVHQENEFTFLSTLSSTATAAANSVYENKVFFGKTSLDYLYQFYVYDEFETHLDSIEVDLSLFDLSASKREKVKFEYIFLANLHLKNVVLKLIIF
jgi:hypothetical protein